MNVYMKTLVNISGITKRNHNIPLVCVGKICGNTLILQLVYSSIGTLQPFDIQKFSQKLMHCLGHYAFISFSIPTR
jgi:hypothetical protein